MAKYRAITDVKSSRQVLLLYYSSVVPMLACMGLLLFSASIILGASPAIRFQEDVFVFQPILEGESVDITFKFSNGGEEPLVIHDAVTSCGCTTADYPSYPLMPGQSGMLKTTFHSKGHAGANDISLLVKSNDPTAPTKTLHIRGKVIRQWQVRPNRFILTNLRPGSTLSQKFQITNFMKEPLQIRVLVGVKPHIRLLSKPKEVAPGRSQTIAFEVSLEGLETGQIRQSSIGIQAANAEMQLIEIPVLMKLK
ncbi:MAG: DUF1573 domain-containing protein [Deltaproteobacteria bacterium]